jgi:hypothetical protein
VAPDSSDKKLKNARFNSTSAGLWCIINARRFTGLDLTASKRGTPNLCDLAKNPLRRSREKRSLYSARHPEVLASAMREHRVLRRASKMEADKRLIRSRRRASARFLPRQRRGRCAWMTAECMARKRLVFFGVDLR